MDTSTHLQNAKDISCRVTRTLLLYVRQNNQGRLGPLLDGLGFDEAYLLDIHNWVSHATAQILYQRMIDILEDENATYKMALNFARYQSLGILDRVFRMVGNPWQVYSQAEKFNAFFKLTGSMKVMEMGDTWALLEDRYHGNSQKTRYDCNVIRGALASVPTMFDLPLAEVEEIECQAAPDEDSPSGRPDHPRKGAGACLYRVSWTQKRKPFWERIFLSRKYHDQAIQDLQQANILIQTKYDEVKRLAEDLEIANQELKVSKAKLESQQAALAESERKYKNIFEYGLDLLCIHDLKGNILETNLHYKEGYGWRREDLEGVNIRDLIPDRYKQDFDAYLHRVMTKGSDKGYLKGITKSGEAVTLEYRNRLILDREGKPEAVQGAAWDVSDRIRAQRALKESEAKYRELVQHAPAGIYEFDMEKLKFTSVNDVMCEYSGYTEEEFMALDPFTLLHEDSLKTLNKLIEDVYAHRTDQQVAEYRVKGKNGREFWVLSNSKFFYENGVPKKAMSVVHDLTDIRNAEAEKRNLQAKLQHAQKLESLGTLAGGVAHDLNNILSGIVSYPELMLLDLPEDSRLRKPLLAVKKSGEKAAEIVQDLLTLARRGVAAKRVLSLNQILKDFMASPEYKKIIDSHESLVAETHLTEDVLNIIGSEVHISKSMMNLVINAADAMPRGGKMTISTASRYLDTHHNGFEIIPEGEYSILQVTDEGIGIPAADLSKIFEPFYTKKVMGRSGSGLGMSVVWGTIKDHDGFIDIHSEEGSGTTFTLYFPVSRGDKEVEEKVYIEDYLGQGESILVVDDSEEQRELAKGMMQRLGYVVAVAAGGQEAVDLLKERSYDLLILDMIMPMGMNGLETYKAVLDISPGQKAIIVSGFAETELVHETQRLGAGAYVKKPYSLEKIGMAVKSALMDTQ